MSYFFHKISVLAVEDNDPMRELIISILKTFGIGEVFHAADGQTGLKLYREKNPDIIISDWMMPGMDGLEMTKKIRNLPLYKYSDVPIILMTGQTNMSMIEDAREAGVTEFLAKPFSIEALAKHLTCLIERPRPFVQAPHFRGPDRRRKKNTADMEHCPARRSTDTEGIFNYG